MDNIKIDISKDKIYIKKGKIKLKYLYSYIFCFFLINIAVVLFILKKEEKKINNFYILNFLEKFDKLIHLIFIVAFLFFLICISVFFFSFLRNLHLETILLTQIMKINGIDYEVIMEPLLFKGIKVNKNYRANYSFSNRGTYYSHFKDKCTITFITKDNKEYEWGYTLSYQKGMEIKKIIEDRINLELNKRDE